VESIKGDLFVTIKTPTTLVLGAGASTHCGYPLGIQLINDVVRMHQQNLLKVPYGFAVGEVDSLVTRLSRSAHYSIDAFLEGATEHTDLGKYLIAASLNKCESLDRLFPPHDSGWYQYLFNALLGSDESPFSENKLTIVTFNYDRSVEAYLLTALMNRFSMTETDAARELQRIPNHHVHGLLGDYPSIPYERVVSSEELFTISKGINIIHEIHDRDPLYCNDEFRRAAEAIDSSTKLVFLGFGFHYDNVRRLAIDWSNWDGTNIYSTFYAMRPREYDRLIERLAGLGYCLHRRRRGKALDPEALASTCPNRQHSDS